MPNRILKESINESRGLSQCSFVVQDFYKRLITYADDYGRFSADEEIIRARLYPREIDVVSEEDIQQWLIELAGIGKITFFTAKPKKEIYGCFPNWSEHQRVRDSRKKMPDPEDTSVNDWYLRRFIPLDMKVKVLERDKCKCAVCGRLLTSCTDAKRAVKLGGNLFYIDHIAPLQQGERASLENLQSTCPDCNLERQRYFTAQEILEITTGGSDLPQPAVDNKKQQQPAADHEEQPQPAANCDEPLQTDTTCGNLPQSAAIRRNSPQSAATRRNPPPESNPNPIQSEAASNPRACAREGCGGGDPPDDGSDFVAYLSNNLLPMSSGNMEALRELMEDGITPELVKTAVDIAMGNGVRTWAYVQSILNGWIVAGVKTVAEAKLEHEQRKGKLKQQLPRGQPAQNEPPAIIGEFY
jgi:DnaD/phage-associated family protein